MLTDPCKKIRSTDKDYDGGLYAETIKSIKNVESRFPSKAAFSLSQLAAPLSMIVREITAAATIPLRHTVLRTNRPVADCNFPGDELPSTFHIGGFDGDQLVTIASVYVEQELQFRHFDPAVQFRLRGMATAASHRGDGFGKAVVASCLNRAWESGCEIFWCNARTSASGFYARLGFEQIAEEFLIPGVGAHKVMYVRRK